MTGKVVRNILVGLALGSVVFLTGYRFGQKNISDEIAKVGGVSVDLALMARVRGKLASMFLEKDKMTDKEMSYGAIEGMVASLGDPYTVFLPPKENKSSNESLQGEFGGVGIQLGYKENSLAVMSPLPKTPAERAGLLAGDLILKISDKGKGVDRDTQGISLDEAVDLIRGKIGSEVTLKMYREGKSETFEVVLERENIVIPSMEVEWLEREGKNIAWIKLYKFTEQVYKDWPKVVDGILEKKLSGNFGGIVVDLRNNPGGYLQASVLVASDFIPKGVVVEQVDANGKKETYNVEVGRGKLIGEKLAVMVNGGSASASEILAGAIKDYKKGILVGQKTFGKGTVQQPEEFSDGSGLHVTVAKWLLPSGKNIHNEGIDPDIEVKPEIESEGEQKDVQLEKAVEQILKI